MSTPGSSHASSANRNIGLDAMRALAITLVLLAHTLPTSWLPNQAWTRGKVFLGILGVELFFALSGYLIGTILLTDLIHGRFTCVASVQHFWRRRWFRTLPNYYLFLFLYLALSFRSKGALPEGWSGFLWFGQALAWPHPTFFPEAWSLAVEEWFYLLAPVLLLGFLQVPKLSKLAAFLLTVAVLATVPVVLRTIAHPESWKDGVRKVALFRLDAIAFGVLAAFAKSVWPRLWAWKRLCTSTAILILSGTATWYFIHSPDIDDSSFARVAFLSLVPVAAGLLLPWFESIPTPPRIITCVLQRLSLWSYSIYLCHGIFNAYSSKVLKAMLGEASSPDSISRFTLVWVASIGFAGFIYHYFERPIMKLRDK